MKFFSKKMLLFLLPFLVFFPLSVLGSLIERYHVIYSDYLSDPRFLDEDYFNLDHVNAKGSLKFSQMIEAEINRPYFSQGSSS